MFERYTEKARRVIFFARYEASQYGSPVIDTEHLLLGMIREEKRAFKWAPEAQTAEAIRQRIDGWLKKNPATSTAIDLPLSGASKHILHRAKDEADRLNSRHIGTEHLFLALLREPDCQSAKLLLELGANVEKLRLQCAAEMYEGNAPTAEDREEAYLRRSRFDPITLHGTQRLLRLLLETVLHYRKQNLHWVRRAWTARDIVIERKTGKISFDLSLASNSEVFELANGGWKKDHCAVCRWELFESKDDESHGIGYTNGREWICSECYEKFWDRPDFVSGSFSEIT